MRKEGLLCLTLWRRSSDGWAFYKFIYCTIKYNYGEYNNNTKIKLYKLANHFHVKK